MPSKKSASVDEVVEGEEQTPRNAAHGTAPATAPAMRDLPKSFDRRTYIRANLDVPVMLDAANTHLCVRCLDASAGGMLVESRFALEPGAEVDIYFELPNRMAIETRGRVLRCTGGAVALAFIQIDPNAQLALRSYCRLSAIRNRPGAPRRVVNSDVVRN